MPLEDTISLSMASDMASQIIAAQKTGGLDAAILDPKKQGFIEEMVKGSKLAEKHLNLPLKEDHDPFFDDVPAHLKSVLHPVLRFIYEGLPEYDAWKFWEARQGMTLSQKIQDAIHSNKGKQADDFKISIKTLNNQDDVKAALPIIPDLDFVVHNAPEAALKTMIPQEAWSKIDSMVGNIAVQSLQSAQKMLGIRAHPEAVQKSIDDVRSTAYEIIARKFFKIPSNHQKGQPITPTQIASIVLASNIEGQEAQDTVQKWPFVYATLSGLYDLPFQSSSMWSNLMKQLGKQANSVALFQKVSNGSIGYIFLSQLNDDIMNHSIGNQSPAPHLISGITQNAKAASDGPGLSLIVSNSEIISRGEFEKAKMKTLNEVFKKSEQISNPPVKSEQPLAIEDQDELPEEHEMEQGFSSDFINKLVPPKADVSRENSKQKPKKSDLRKIIPAIRLKNGQILTGPDHEYIIENMADGKEKESLQKEKNLTDGENDSFGFLDKDNNFITRNEAQKKYGFRHSEELEAMKA